MVPFLVAALAPHSVSFADGPVLKFALHTATGLAGEQARKLAEYRLVQLAVERVVLLLACLASVARCQSIPRSPSKIQGQSLACL